jgi:HD-like signal output (HDOD) protein
MPADRPSKGVRIVTTRMDKLVAKIDDAFTLPMVMQEVLELTSDPNVNAKKVAKAIGRDPVLTAKVLRVSNSSLFGFLFRTSDLSSAVVRLGVKNVRQIVTAVSIGKLFRDEGVDEGEYSRVNVWRHSVALATMNDLLCSIMPINALRHLKGEAMIAGLVHDIGIIFMDQYLGEQYRAVIGEAAETEGALRAIELRRLEFDHAQLGGRVLQKWRLPHVITDAVTAHHSEPGRQDHPLTQITQIGEMLVASFDVGYTDQKRVSRQAFSFLQARLGLMGKTVVTMRKNFPQRLEEALDVFAIEPDETDQEGAA